MEILYQAKKRKSSYLSVFSVKGQNENLVSKIDFQNNKHPADKNSTIQPLNTNKKLPLSLRNLFTHSSQYPVYMVNCQINNIQANKENSLGRYPFLLAYQMPNANSARSSRATITPATIPPVLLSPKENTVGKSSSRTGTAWWFIFDGGTAEHLRTSILTALQRWEGPALFIASQ